MKAILDSAVRISMMVCLLVVFHFSGVVGLASEIPPSSGIWHSHMPQRTFPAETHDKLVKSLRRITGFGNLEFTTAGELVLGEEQEPSNGSDLARQLLRAIMSTGDAFILEDHSKSPDVRFGQLDEGTRYVNVETGQRTMIWTVRIDPDDFRGLEASPAVRASFDEGFTVFHELLHGFGYDDALRAGDVGECESLLNEVRSELGLPTRAEYFGTYFAITPVIGTVRLRFERPVRGAKSSRRRDDYLFFTMAPTQLAESFAPCRTRQE